MLHTHIGLRVQYAEQKKKYGVLFTVEPVLRIHYGSMSYTGLTRRQTLFVILWLGLRDT